MGPLTGIKIVELAGIGPGPFCAMMLADMGADVIRVDRADSGHAAATRPTPPADVLNRGRRSIGVDLKHPDGVETVLELVEPADALIEGFRPGVMERLGLGPDVCLARNPRLVYGRMTGWGQDGPLRPRPPATTSTTSRSPARSTPSAGPARRPVPPLNLVGDFGGGGMLLAFGIVCGAARGAARRARARWSTPPWSTARPLLMTMIHALAGHGHLGRRAGHQPARHRRALLRRLRDAPTASTCRSGRSSRSSTPSCCGSPASTTTGARRGRWTKAQWPALKERLAAIFRTKTRDEWCAHHGGHRRVLRPVLSHERGAAAPAQRRPRARSSRSPASCSRRRRPGSAARPARSSARRRTPASTPTRCSPTGASTADRDRPSSVETGAVE